MLATTNSIEEFTVKQSKATNLIIGSFFLLLFAGILYNHLFNQQHTFESTEKQLNYLLASTLLSSLGFFAAGLKHVTIITINTDGIYVAGELKTNWQNFISAESTEKEVTGSPIDNFIVLIKYYKDDGSGFVTEIPMQDTYDKSGEEVIDAIKKFAALANRFEDPNQPSEVE